MPGWMVKWQRVYWRKFLLPVHVASFFINRIFLWASYRTCNETFTRSWLFCLFSFVYMSWQRFRVRYLNEFQGLLLPLTLLSPLERFKPIKQLHISRFARAWKQQARNCNEYKCIFKCDKNETSLGMLYTIALPTRGTAENHVVKLLER